MNPDVPCPHFLISLPSIQTSPNLTSVSLIITNSRPSRRSNSRCPCSFAPTMQCSSEDRSSSASSTPPSKLQIALPTVSKSEKRHPQAIHSASNGLLIFQDSSLCSMFIRFLPCRLFATHTSPDYCRLFTLYPPPHLSTKAFSDCCSFDGDAKVIGE